MCVLIRCYVCLSFLYLQYIYCPDKIQSIQKHMYASYTKVTRTSDSLNRKARIFSALVLVLLDCHS